MVPNEDTCMVTESTRVLVAPKLSNKQHSGQHANQQSTYTPTETIFSVNHDLLSTNFKQFPCTLRTRNAKLSDSKSSIPNLWPEILIVDGTLYPSTSNNTCPDEILCIAYVNGIQTKSDDKTLHEEKKESETTTKNSMRFPLFIVQKSTSMKYPALTSFHL